MGNQRKMDKAFEKFTWTIENFSKLITNKKTYSGTFFLNGHPWRIIIFRSRIGLNYLSVFLDAGDIAHLPQGWSRHANFKLALINQVCGNRTITKETEQELNARDSYCGFLKFIQLKELCDSRNGYIVDDTCIIRVLMISARKLEFECQANEAVIDLVDFRGLGKIEKAFVPLLEEVCSWHPSLLYCLWKRNCSRRFTEWAFTALGRVLHFLKTKKVKDMNDDACNHLQILWEELETFGFDLSWLEPHLQSAVDMKSYIERAAKVKRLMENIDVLDMDLTVATRSYTKRIAQAKKLKEVVDYLAEALKTATRNLDEAEEGFVGRDLDAELGYGRPYTCLTKHICTSSCWS